MIISIANYSKSINDPEKSLGEKYKIQGYDNECIERQQAGEDHSLMVNLPNNEKILGVFDGHGGPKCQFVSFYVGTLLVDKLLEKWEIIREEGEEEIKKIITNMFKETHQELSDSNNMFIEINNCGTTVSLVLIMNKEGTRKMITANVGDSPIIWYGDEELIECGLEHNCDNKEAVELYLKRMEKRGKPPKTVVFGRINCGGYGDPVWDSNHDGNPQPLAVFKYIDGKAELHDENYKKLAKYYPKGCQSIRYPPMVTENGVTRVKPGHECENWGSTLEGNLQILNSIGDLKYMEDISYEPYISIRDINKKGILLVASDGFTDLCSLEEWGNYLKELDLEDKESSKLIENKIFSLSEQDKMFKYYEIEKKRFPMWDDVSAIILPLENFIINT